MSRIRILGSICLVPLASVVLHAQTGLWRPSKLPAAPVSSFSLINFADSSNGWVFSADGHGAMTSDGGMTWAAIPGLPDSLSVLQARLYDSATGVLLARGSTGWPRAAYLLRTTDRGVSWGISNLPVVVDYPGIVSLATRRAIGCRIPTGGILRSSDLGVTWDTLSTSLPRGGGIAIMKNGRIFCWSYIAGMLNDGFLATSEDSGRTWTPVGEQTGMSSSGATIYNENMASFDLTFGDELYLDQKLLLYNASLDSIRAFSGGSAHFLGSGALYDSGMSLVLPSRDPVMTKRSDSPDDSLYVIQSVGTGLHVSTLATVSPKFAWILSDSNTVFRRVDLLTGVAQTSTPPREYRLYQNYPNPFNPTTTIRYGLPERSHVTLSVFNTLGQRVIVLVHAVEEAGEHSVRFDGTGLASGVYLYRLAAENNVVTKKLVILR